MVILGKPFAAGVLVGTSLTSLVYDLRDIYRRNNGVIIRIKNKS